MKIEAIFYPRVTLTKSTRHSATGQNTIVVAMKQLG